MERRESNFSSKLCRRNIELDSLRQSKTNAEQIHDPPPKKSCKVSEMYSEDVLKPYSRLFEWIRSFPESFPHLRFHPWACLGAQCSCVWGPVRHMRVLKNGPGGPTWAGLWIIASPAWLLVRFSAENTACILSVVLITADHKWMPSGMSIFYLIKTTRKNCGCFPLGT